MALESQGIALNELDVRQQAQPAAETAAAVRAVVLSRMNPRVRLAFRTLSEIFRLVADCLHDPICAF